MPSNNRRSHAGGLACSTFYTQPIDIALWMINIGKEESQPASDRKTQATPSSSPASVHYGAYNRVRDVPSAGYHAPISL
jgi:hypothetical protein